MRRFAGLFLAACMTVAVPMATVCYAEEVSTAEAASEESSAEQAAEETGKKELNIAQTLDGVTLPANAEQITYTYHGVVYESAAKTATGLYLLPVIQEDASVIWYVYNEEIDDAIPYVDFNGIDASYAIILPDGDITVPSGYEAVPINVAGRTVPAWFNSQAGDSDMYLIYAMDSNGNEGFYRFDGTTGNCLRFVADPDVEKMSEASSLGEELSGLQQSYNELESQYEQEVSKLNNSVSLHQQNYSNLQDKYKQYGLIAVAVLGGVTLLMLIFFIMMISKSSKLRKTKKKLAEAENAIKAARAQQNRQRNSEASRNRVRREGANLGDTRMTEGREEGTSRVRRVQRTLEKGFDKSTTTSKVVRVSREGEAAQAPAQDTLAAQPVRRQPAARPAQATAGTVGQEGRQVRRPAAAGQPVRRQPASRPGSSRPTAETKIFDKAPAEATARPQVQELDDLDDISKKQRVPSAKAAPAKEAAIEAADLDKISEQLNSFGMNDESPVDSTFMEAEMTEPEDVYVSSDEDEDDEFSLTDFKDI